LRPTEAAFEAAAEAPRAALAAFDAAFEAEAAAEAAFDADAPRAALAAFDAAFDADAEAEAAFEAAAEAPRAALLRADIDLPREADLDRLRRVFLAILYIYSKEKNFISNRFQIDINFKYILLKLNYFISSFLFTKQYLLMSNTFYLPF